MSIRFSILVIHNGDMDWALLEDTLSHKGYLVAGARSGQQGLAAIAVERFDLILLDDGLPDMPGLELLLQLPETLRQRTFFFADIKHEDKLQVAKDAGARFVFEKPFSGPVLQETISSVLKEQNKPTPNGRPKKARPAKASYSVLVVDDSEDVRELLRRRLTRVGYWVTTAEDGRDALVKLGQKGFDLVLLDLAMPEMDGYDVLSEIKMKREWQELPVIMLTAQCDASAVQQCQQLGANDFVGKPFDFSVLSNKIRCSLGLLK